MRRELASDEDCNDHSIDGDDTCIEFIMTGDIIFDIIFDLKYHLATMSPDC